MVCNDFAVHAYVPDSTLCVHGVSTFFTPTQPVFDSLLGSSAAAYCPCTTIMFSENMNSSGRCNDEIRNRTRASLQGIAEAGQYVSIVYVSVACRETVPVVEQIVRQSASRVVIIEMYDRGISDGGDSEVSQAWGKVINAAGQLRMVRALLLDGMRGNESRAPFQTSIGRLSTLFSIDVINTDWHNPMPSTAGRLTNLLEFRMKHNPRLRELPVGLFIRMSSLREVVLADNRLEALPSVEKNMFLFKMELENNRLTVLGRQPDSLVILKAYNNRLNALPRLGNKITKLYLGHNRLVTPSLWPSQARLPDSLRFLSIAHNRISAIPAFVQQLPRLGYLDLSGNNITTLVPAERGTNFSSDDTFTAQRSVLGRNASLLLVGGNPVCGTTSDSGVLDPVMWGGRWSVQCRSQCSATCPVSIGWKSSGTVEPWLSDAQCDHECNSVECDYDGGDCTS